MNKLKYLLFIFIVLLSSNVYASEFNMNNYTSAILGGTKNRYRATEIYNTGTANTYTFGTRYNGKISTIETYFEYPFEENTTYTLTYNMNTEDFRNNFGGSYWWDCSEDMNATNQHTGSFSYISYKKVKFTFKPTDNTTCIRVLLGSTNPSSSAITGISNWRLDSITIYDPAWQSGSGSGQGSIVAPSPSPSTNQDIINNQNNNTEDIINNNNQNTQDIINSNNENTDRIIDNQKDLLGDKCSNMFDSSTIVQGSVAGENSSQRVSSRQSLFLEPGTYTFTTNLSSSFRYGILIRDSAPPVSTGSSYDSGWLTDVSSKTFTISTAGYFMLNFSKTDNSNLIPTDILSFKFMLVEGSSGKTYCEFDSYTSKIDELKNKIDGVGSVLNQQNEYLMDDSNPNISDNDFLNTFNSVGVSDPLNYLLTLPTQLINKIVSLSDNCQPIDLGTLYGVHITLPCLNIGNIVGSTVWNIIDVIFSVSLIAVILKNLYDTFSNLLTLGAEKEAKEKFSMPTPMDFLSMILGGDR